MVPDTIAFEPAYPAADRQFLALHALKNLDPTVLRRERETPMHALIRMGHFDAVVFGELAQRNSKMVHIENLTGATPLYVAAEAGNLQAIAWLLDHGADVDARQRGGYTPFLVAAGARHSDAMQLLLKRGADPHIRSTWCGGLADVLEIAPEDICLQQPWLAKALMPPPPRARFMRSREEIRRAELETAVLSGCDI